MIKCDITTTACIRPKTLMRTLTSFSKYMFGNFKEYRLIINIDPIGEEAHNTKDILKMLQIFNFNEIVVNTPASASYPKAVIWCWSNVQSPYVFHLEDDWILLRKVKLDNMISIMENNKNLAQLKLSKYSIIEHNEILSNEIVINEKHIRLNPSLINKAFLDMIIRYMTPYSNPEKQFDKGHKKLWNISQFWQFATYCPYGFNHPKVIKDIGRKWMRTFSFHKTHKLKGGNTTSFTNWEKK